MTTQSWGRRSAQATVMWLIALCALAQGCGAETTLPAAPTTVPPAQPPPTPPAAVDPPAPPPAATWSGRVTDTMTGSPITGFSATLSGERVAISAPGYVTRETRASVTSVDLIPTAGFDMEFYGQFARNSYQGAAMEPLWVLPEPPMFYMETEGPKGFSRPTAVILEELARKLVPLLTGGRFQLRRWETGPLPRTPEPGWIMIERSNHDDACGRGRVGALAGHIWLNGDSPGCVAVIRSVFAHELGHAFGFWHVNRVGAMMFPGWDHPSATDRPTEVEQRSAAIAYSRPRGNRDMDVDP